MDQTQPSPNGAPAQLSLPRCQFCGEDPAPVMIAMMSQPAGQIAVFHCAACKAIYSCQFVQVQRRQPESGLILPGG